MIILFPLLLLLILVIWYFYPWWSLAVFGFTSTPEVIGQFGDSFGGLNTLFSGFAFTGIIVSIYLQSKELRETRTELENQKKEMKAQAEALNRQVFESTLFQLLQLHTGIASSITASNKTGRDSFQQLYNSYISYYMSQAMFEGDENPILKIKKQYNLFHDENGHTIGHYYRNVYQIIKFIDKSSYSEENKKFYSNLLRAQMSTYELALLFYNCISDIGCEKFKPLIEKYEMLEHLPLLPDFSKEEITYYKKNAYGTTNIAMLQKFDT